MLVVHQCLLWHLLILQGVESCTQCSPHPWLPFSKSLLGHSSKCSLWGTKFLFWEVKYGEVLLLNQVFVLFSKGSCKHGVGSKQVHTKNIYIYMGIPVCLIAPPWQQWNKMFSVKGLILRLILLENNVF